MHDRCRSMATALVVAVALSALSAAASATPVRIVNWERGFRRVWTTLEFRSSGGETVRCPVTLEGSLPENVIENISGFLYAQVTRAAVGEGSCTGGRARALSETLPWEVTYESLTGTLPLITGIRSQIIHASFTIESSSSGLTCTVRTSAAHPLKVLDNVRREEGGELTIPTMQVEASSIPLEGSFCSLFTGSMGGTSSASVQTPGILQRVQAPPMPPGNLRIEPETILIRRPNIEQSIRLKNIAASGATSISIREIRMFDEIRNEFEIFDPNRCTETSGGLLFSGGGECNFHLRKRSELTTTRSGIIQIVYEDAWHIRPPSKTAQIRWEAIE